MKITQKMRDAWRRQSGHTVKFIVGGGFPYPFYMAGTDEGEYCAKTANAAINKAIRHEDWRLGKETT